MNSVLLACALLAVLGARQCLSCSCQPEHPTQQYCRSQFVMKAKIVSKKEIFEPTVEPTTTSPPPPEPKTSPSYETEPHVLPSDLRRPAFIPNLELLNQGEVRRLPPGGLMPLGGGLRAPAPLIGGMFPPGGGMFPGENDRRPIELEYTIKVDKIFKVDEEVKGLEPKTTMKIYTAPWDGMCGVSGLENGQTYLLSGSYWDDKLRISTCNWIDIYDDLTRRQKQGVKSAYKQDCVEEDDNVTTNCKICFHENCGEHKHDRCIWEAFSQYEDCEGRHSRCTRNSRGRCQWQRKKEYKKCDALRQQEKRTALFQELYEL